MAAADVATPAVLTSSRTPIGQLPASVSSNTATVRYSSASAVTGAGLNLSRLNPCYAATAAPSLAFSADRLTLSSLSGTSLMITPARHKSRRRWLVDRVFRKT